MKRRAFVKTVATLTGALTLRPPAVRALGPGQALRIVQLRYEGHWNPHPGAITALAEQIRARTSIDVGKEPLHLDITDPALSHLPLALLSGDGAFSLSDDQRVALKRWLDLGGFLIIDNAGLHRSSESFNRCVHKEFEPLFPARPMSRISSDHVIFRTFYRVDYPVGRAIHKPYMEGLSMGTRYGVVLIHNDLLGAMARDPIGQFIHRPSPGGDNQREMAFRFGINLMMYAQCLHYKDDQVHLDYLLRSRKWKIRKTD